MPTEIVPTNLPPTLMKTTSGKPVQSGPNGTHAGRWTKEEHILFLDSLNRHGREWKKVAAEIKTRTSAQVRSHAQKYFSKLLKEADPSSKQEWWMPKLRPHATPSQKVKTKDTIAGRFGQLHIEVSRLLDTRKDLLLLRSEPVPGLNLTSLRQQLEQVDRELLQIYEASLSVAGPAELVLPRARSLLEEMLRALHASRPSPISMLKQEEKHSGTEELHTWWRTEWVSMLEAQLRLWSTPQNQGVSTSHDADLQMQFSSSQVSITTLPQNIDSTPFHAVPGSSSPSRVADVGVSTDLPSYTIGRRGGSCMRCGKAGEGDCACVNSISSVEELGKELSPHKRSRLRFLRRDELCALEVLCAAAVVVDTSGSFSDLRCDKSEPETKSKSVDERDDCLVTPPSTPALPQQSPPLSPLRKEAATPFRSVSENDQLCGMKRSRESHEYDDNCAKRKQLLVDQDCA